MIIDTHLHLIDKSALNYPWLAGVPALDRDFLYATYAAEAKRVGLAASLHMEVDVDPAEIELETREIARLAGEPGSLLKGAIAACRPEEEGFAAYLERQEENAFVKGFRRVLHVVADDLSEQPLFRENVKRPRAPASPSIFASCRIRFRKRLRSPTSRPTFGSFSIIAAFRT